MDDAVDPAELRRLRARTEWAEVPEASDARARDGECATEGHPAVVMEPDDVPRCRHCGASLSPETLRRLGIRGRRA